MSYINKLNTVLNLIHVSKDPTDLFLISTAYRNVSPNVIDTAIGKRLALLSKGVFS